MDSGFPNRGPFSLLRKVDIDAPKSDLTPPEEIQAALFQVLPDGVSLLERGNR